MLVEHILGKLDEGKKKNPESELPKTRNFVAKNAMSKSGAGAHEDKKGKKASRERQKRDWKKYML